MKLKIFGLVFSILLITVLAGLASAAVVAAPVSFSNSTLPSDDTTTRTLMFNFNLTSSDIANANIILSVAGLSGWAPALSKTSDAIAPSATNTYNLQVTAPKYTNSPTAGAIAVNYSNGTSIASIPVSITLNNHNSLIFTPAPAALTKSANLTNVTLRNDGNQVLNSITASIANNSITDSEGEVLSLSLVSSKAQPFSLNPGENITLNVSYSSDPEDIDLLLGETSTIMRASSGSANATTTIKFINEFCDFGERGNDVRIVSVSDETSSNGNFKWELLQDVEVEVKVENNANDDDDITVELMVYDKSDGNDLYSAEQTVFVEQDERESVLFNFILPADTPDNGRIYVKAYIDEDEQCVSHWSSTSFETINLESKERWDVGMTDVEVESPLLCGERATVEAEVHNIGKEDQNKVLVSLTSDDLGIDEDITVTNLDVGESKKISFPIEIPRDAEEKLYQLEIQARHHYNKGSDNYEDLTERILKSFNVQGNCIAKPSSEILISPTLESEARAGRDMIIRTSIKNLGKDTMQVSIVPFGYEAWSQLKSVEPSAVTLAGGESKDVSITLTPNEDASGDQRFTIRAASGTKTSDQEVSVFVQPTSSPVSGLWNSIRENWVVWIIVLANIILIVAIIIAAVRLSRRE